MIRRLLLWLSLAVTAMAQVSLAPPPKLQFLDNNGHPLTGGKIFTYASGTSNLLPSFTDGTGLVQNSNPVVLDSGGFGSVWLTTGSLYRVIVQNANGVQQYLVDNVVGIGSATGGGGGGGGGTGAPPGITYVVVTTAYWSQTSTTVLTAGSPGTVILTPCPAGVDYTSTAGYQVYLSGDGFNEAVAVTAGATGSGNCSITFTPFFSHVTYTISSASSGIQETINVACGVSPQPNFNGQCNPILPTNGPYLSGPTYTLNNYQVYGTIFFHANQSSLSGFGATLFCHGRGPCLQVGDQVAATHYNSNAIQGIAFRSPDNNSGSLAYSGCAITQTQTTGTTATVTTSNPCGFRPGDLVTIQFTDDKAYRGDAIVASSSGTTFTFTKHALGTKAAQATPGVVALAYDAILDNSQGTHFLDVVYDVGGEIGSFNHFFDFWDDEGALIEHFNNNGIGLTKNANWTGSFVYSGGNPIGPTANPTQQWAPVITLRDSSITANLSNGITVDNSNGVYIENTVIQASGPWQVKVSNETGNFQGAYLKNIYSEGSAGLNPLTPAYSPFAGTGTAGLIGGMVQPNATFDVLGNGGLAGFFPPGGSGGTPYSYFVVANDWTGVSCGLGSHTQTSPMQVLNWSSTGSDTIPVLWPRVANGTDSICYDLIRITTPIGPTNPSLTYPYFGGCPGGAGGICGTVTAGLSQAAACGGSLVCSYSDLGSSTTSSYSVLQGNYGGPLNFWPGTIVMVNKPAQVDSEAASTVGVGLNGGPTQIASQCLGYGAPSPGGFTTCLTNPVSANNSVKNQTATLLMDGPNSGGGMSLSKGRLNFSTTPFSIVQPHHFITLIDSQPALTQATPTFRPSASSLDTWIGTDVAPGGVALTAGRLAFGAPISISRYIGQTGDGVTANWLERLTSALEEYNLLVKFDQGITFPGGAVGQVIGWDGAKFSNVTQGVSIDPQAGTSYVIPSSDNGKLVTGNNAAATAWTGPALALNRVFSCENLGAGLITYTPASGTVNGGATQIIPQNAFCFDYTDNATEQMPVVLMLKAYPDCQDTSGQHLNFTAATGQLGCGTSQLNPPKVLFRGSDLVTSSTTLVAFLSFTFTANAAVNASVDCDFTYTQQTAAVADAFGIQDVTVAPTNLYAQGSVQTAAGVAPAEGNLLTLTTTTATNIVAFTPSAITTPWNAHLHAMIEQPSNAATSLLNVMVSTGNASDSITIKRGAKCVVTYQ